MKLDKALPLLLIGVLGACSQRSLGEPTNHQPTPSMCGASNPTSLCPQPNPSDPATENCGACTMGSNPHCLAPAHSNALCYCAYDNCSSDADCPADTLCVCGGTVANGPPTNTCLPSNCRVDADCGTGEFCAPTLGTCGQYGGIVGYYCTTSRDKCHGTADCSSTSVCSYSQELGYWSCSSSMCSG